MQKIQEMIKELCPDGVEYKKLGEIATFKKGKKVDVSKKYFDNSTPYLGASALRGENFDGYVLAGEGLESKNTDILMLWDGSRAGEIGRQLKGAVASTVMRIRPTESIDSNYLFHFLKYQKYFILNTRTGGGIPHVNKELKDILFVPIPPLPVQEAIVEYLDQFSELEAELEAELVRREQQYEWYRMHLLDFKKQELDENNQPTGKTVDYQYSKEYQSRPLVETIREMTDRLCPEGVEYKKIGDIGKVSMCKRILKKDTSSEGDIPFYKIGTFGKQANSYISQELYNEYKRKYSYPEKGAVLLSAAGTIGRTVEYDGRPAYFQDSNIVWIDNNEEIILNRFLWFYYQIINWNTDGTTIKRIYNEQIRQTLIPIPPLPIQEEIVKILDSFDTLINDMSSGIPAEIEARRKQYEYYREKLLTFNQKVATTSGGKP